MERYALFPYPAVLFLVPVGLRATCYYFRGVWERHLLRHPAQCGEEESFPATTGVVNSSWYGRLFFTHRYFLAASVVLMVPHALDAAAVLRGAGFHLWLGNLLQWLDLMFLGLYLGTCHSVRYFLGSGAACYSCRSGAANRVYRGQSRLNRLHGAFFWLSLFFLGLYFGFVVLMGRGVVRDVLLL